MVRGAMTHPIMCETIHRLLRAQPAGACVLASLAQSAVKHARHSCAALHGIATCASVRSPRDGESAHDACHEVLHCAADPRPARSWGGTPARPAWSWLGFTHAIRLWQRRGQQASSEMHAARSDRVYLMMVIIINEVLVACYNLI